MIYDIKMLQIELAYGILDVYSDNITSFTMTEKGILTIMERIGYDIINTFYIEV